MMKKILLVLFCLVLCGCTSRTDYYVLSFNDFSLTVGYDNLEFVNLVFETDVKDTMQANQTIKDIDVKFSNRLVGKIDLINNKDKQIPADQAIVSKFTIFLKDINQGEFKINDIKLDKSIKKNCETFSGKYIEANGFACVIEKPVKDSNNSIILYGDYLNLDQDQLDHITISID